MMRFITVARIEKETVGSFSQYRGHYDYNSDTATSLNRRRVEAYYQLYRASITITSPTTRLPRPLKYRIQHLQG